MKELSETLAWLRLILWRARKGLAVDLEVCNMMWLVYVALAAKASEWISDLVAESSSDHEVRRYAKKVAKFSRDAHDASKWLAAIFMKQPPKLPRRL